jgi:alanine racemase
MTDDRRVWAEIDLKRFTDNIKIVRNNILSEKTDMMAVIKADGYGHGAVECAKAAELAGVKSFGVAIFEEGAALRNNGVGGRILLLGYTPQSDFDDVINLGLSQTVFEKGMAFELSRRACKLNKIANIHIKIDTGMSRLGFQTNGRAFDEILEIAGLPGINIDGVYSHLADADNDDEGFSTAQFDRFTSFTQGLKDKGLNAIYHFCNSAGVLKFPHMALDLVRTGNVLYGLTPTPNIDIWEMGFRPVMSIKSRISAVRFLEENTSVGYDRSFFTQRRTVVGTIPVGYADGYMHGLSNRAKVIINGQYANVIGNICMDQLMVDITDIKDANMGSEVMLMGESGGKRVRADDLAEILNTINYEVVCAVSKRVPRVYV